MQSLPRSALPCDHISCPYPPTSCNQQPRDDTLSVPLSFFQQTQLQADETFYATFPAAPRLAKLTEEQYFMYGAVAFHYDTVTGYIANDYVAVGDSDNLPSPRPLDPSNSHINNPFDFLHFNYSPNDTVTTRMFQSKFLPIPNSILENDLLVNVVHGSHYNSSVRWILNLF